MKAAELFDLKGKRAVITGASRGIGRAVAESYHELGASVALLARSSAVLDAAQALHTPCAPAYGFQVDLQDRAAREQAFEKAVNALGGVDILINNAGMCEDFPAADYPLDAWDRILELNLTSALHLSQLAAKCMIPQRSGKIINLCSLHSYLGKRQIEGYAASKGALKLLTQSLAHEWAPYGICVNGVAPGFIETEISSGLRQDPVEYPKTLDRLPMGRWGTPEELRGAFIFLGSAASDYVTGHILAVDGGILAV